MTTPSHTSTAKKNKPNFERLVAWVLTISGTLGFAASLMLSIEEIHHLKHPTQALACDINPLIGCGSIMNTWQGHVFFGIPNQFFGLAACSVLITLGVLLLAKVKFPRWIWQGLQIGALGGVLFVGWFIYQSLFVLNHLCPYCMVTWTAILPVAWYVTVYNIHAGNLPAWTNRFKAFVTKHHVDVIVGVFVVIIGSILFRFRDFFFG
jgi:uncharacterized membrane protein